MVHCREGEFGFSRGQSVEFNTPIRQIAGDQFQGRTLVAVRTWEGVSILEVELHQCHVSLKLIDSMGFKYSPLHVEFNSVIVGQILIILHDGSCYVWDSG
jgi:hypothetical protein